MSEHFRITDENGDVVELDITTDFHNIEPRLRLAVDGDQPLPSSALLDVARASVLRDALTAFIDGEFDRLLRQAREDGA